jgi:hypothetical protein
MPLASHAVLPDGSDACPSYSGPHCVAVCSLIQRTAFAPCAAIQRIASSAVTAFNEAGSHNAVSSSDLDVVPDQLAPLALKVWLVFHVDFSGVISGLDMSVRFTILTPFLEVSGLYSEPTGWWDMLAALIRQHSRGTHLEVVAPAAAEQRESSWGWAKRVRFTRRA